MADIKAIFIFSSPLQFLFSCIVSKKLPKEVQIIGYYYSYEKDFTNLFNEIIQFSSPRIKIIKPLEELIVSKLNKHDMVFFGNRYNYDERKVFIIAKKKTKKLYLYEEGFNTYLNHHFNNSNLNDRDYILRGKNIIKIFLGKLPSHIRLSSFKKVYSTFPIDHLPKKSKWEKLKFDQHKSSRDSNMKTCLFLSQSLVEDGFLDEIVYLNYMNHIFNDLSKTYEKIYFKPHPRNLKNIIAKIFENNDKLEILPKPYDLLPAEFYAMDYDVHLYGFTSSTLIYASSLFDRKSFQCLDNLIIFDQGNIGLKKFRNSVSGLFEKHQLKTYQPNIF